MPPAQQRCSEADSVCCVASGNFRWPVLPFAESVPRQWHFSAKSCQAWGFCPRNISSLSTLFLLEFSKFLKRSSAPLLPATSQPKTKCKQSGSDDGQVMRWQLIVGPVCDEHGSWPVGPVCVRRQCWCSACCGQSRFNCVSRECTWSKSLLCGQDLLKRTMCPTEDVRISTNLPLQSD